MENVNYEDKLVLQNAEKIYVDRLSVICSRNSLRWPIPIINPIDKTKLSCYTFHRRSTTVSLDTFPSISDMVESIIRLQQSVGDQSVRTSGFNILHVDPGMDFCGFAEVRRRDS